MLEAGEAAAQAVTGAAQQAASEAWSEGALLELRKVAQAAALLGSWQYRQKVFAGKAAAAAIWPQICHSTNLLAGC